MIRGVLGSRASIGGVLGSGRGGGGNGLLTGLVAYWGLDEASGNALDKHSGGLTLTQANSPGADTGKVYATARTFASASNQYFSRTSEGALVPAQDFAFTAWIYNTASTAETQTVIGKDAAGQRSYLLQKESSGNGNVLFFAVWVSGAAKVVTATTFGALPLNQWLFVAAWHDGTANTAYISINNGTANSVATGEIDTGGTADFEIGRRSYSGITRPWNGRIGPVMMWKNRTLDATARAALYNGGDGLAYSAFTA